MMTVLLESVNPLKLWLSSCLVTTNMIFLLVSNLPYLYKTCCARINNSNDFTALFFFFFFKQKTAYEISLGLVGSEMCIRDRVKILLWNVLAKCSSRNCRRKQQNYTNNHDGREIVYLHFRVALNLLDMSNSLFI